MPPLLSSSIASNESLCNELMAQRAEVLAIDTNEAAVQRVSAGVSQAVIAFNRWTATIVEEEYFRDLEQAASGGDTHARLALDVYTSEIRRHLGGLLVELGGADVIVFTGGIGENGAAIRSAVCRGRADLAIRRHLEKTAESQSHDRQDHRLERDSVLAGQHGCGVHRSRRRRHRR